MMEDIPVPDEWKYDPMHRLTNNQTTALNLASKGRIPPKYWEHDPNIVDNDGNTVEDYLLKKGKEVPE